MSFINGYQDLETPFSEKTYAKLVGKLERKTSLQLTAASATIYVWTATFNGVIADLGLSLSAVPATGESIVVDVLKNGASVLTGTYTVNPTTGASKFVDLFLVLDPTKTGFAPGDVYTVSRVYTAGSTPAAPSSALLVEPSVKHWRL